jgi:hypothetical protein
VRRLPLTLRALLLVPLLAAVADLTRATLVCGPDGQTCLEAAGRGSLGSFGIAVLVLYAAGAALVVARLTRRGQPLPRRWLTGAAGLAAVCGGQALLVAALGDAGVLGGGWPELAALCAAAGGIVALALRAAPLLARSLRLAAPRPQSPPALVLGALRPVARRPVPRLATAAAGRAPPTLG